MGEVQSSISLIQQAISHMILEEDSIQKQQAQETPNDIAWIKQQRPPRVLSTRPIVTKDNKIIMYFDSSVSPGLWSFDYKTNKCRELYATSKQSKPIYVSSMILSIL